MKNFVFNTNDTLYSFKFTEIGKEWVRKSGRRLIYKRGEDKKGRRDEDTNTLFSR